MSKEQSTAPTSAGSFKYEVEEAAGDLQTISAILIAIGHETNIEVHHGWLSFFGRSVEAVAEHLLEEAERLA